jgi:hypothetical protein
MKKKKRHINTFKMLGFVILLEGLYLITRSPQQFQLFGIQNRSRKATAKVRNINEFFPFEEFKRHGVTLHVWGKSFISDSTSNVRDFHNWWICFLLNFSRLLLNL